MKDRPKILFISRAYPPILGGIENQNYGIANALAKITPTKIIANKGGKKRLPIFLPWILVRGLFVVPRFDVVLFGDGVLAPLGIFWKIFYPKKKYISIVHGLDITFAYKKSLLGKIYRTVNIPALQNSDKLIMVGNETIEQAVKSGIPREKCVFIPNGVQMEEIRQTATWEDLEKVVGMDLAGKKVIFRGGRYVKHKGLEWFIRNVMPQLPAEYILIAAGGGVAKNTAGDENDYPRCVNAVKELKLSERVKLFINMPRADMKVLFNACDLYISPNIKVSGSMEGFGITAIEGAACGRMVMAS
ncbi:MAG: glycosyltransferase family 4 protein, partial [Candidatus Pacebacteria bacterium]|nr:glycosyltransferase family 4 protein [Candidatus Paceibacterota bacterium]